MASRLLWLVDGCHERPPNASIASLLRPSCELEVVPIEPDGPWPQRSTHQPIGFLVAGCSKDPGSAAAVVRGLRARSPLPVLVLLDDAPPDARQALLRAGAVDVLQAPWAGSDSARQRFQLKLATALELMAEHQVPVPTVCDAPRVVAIGSSTGGPAALATVLRGLRLPVPVLVAQHVAPGFDRQLVAWLGSQDVPAVLATDGLRPAAGVTVVAPGDRDLVIEAGACHLLAPAPRGAVPSADRLLTSVATAWGARALGVVLTGMGADGAQGLLRLRQAGARTITQRGDTCVVDGMPASARALGAHTDDLSPDEIHAVLADLARAAPPALTARRAPPSAP